MCWWNSVVRSTKRFNSVVFLRRLKASYSIHLSQHLSWFLFSSWYSICDEQMVLFVSCNFLVIVRRNQFDVSREYLKLTSHDFLKCFGEIIEDWKCWTPWVRSFGMIRIRISDPRSLGSWWIKWANESLSRMDSSVHLIYHDPSDLGSLILIRIISKECSHVFYHYC